MFLIPDEKSDQVESFRDGLDDGAGPSDLPPAYDALSIWHHSNYHSANQYASSPTFPGRMVAGPSHDPLVSDSPSLTKPVLNTDKSLPPHPRPLDGSQPSRNADRELVQRPRARKNVSWLSLLPFVSSVSAKRVRKSVLSVVSDLVVPSSRLGNDEQTDVHEILASVAETCAEHKLSLSTLLQEPFIADHTPMYWAIVHDRQELLVALLVHSRQLSVQAISDIRRACLVNSNQALFHALRVRRPPFHRTNGIQIQSLRAASDNLLLGNRPSDEIHIQHMSDQGFVVAFDIPIWQKRMKGIGLVSVEFIAAGRMWSVTFFSTDPSSPVAIAGKSIKSMNTWQVMVCLVESSPPTYFDSQLVVDVVPPSAPDSESMQTPRLREARSTTFLRSRGRKHQNRYSMYDDEEAHLQTSRGRGVFPPLEQGGYPTSSSSKLPPPTHPTQGALSIHLGSGRRKLARRIGPGEHPRLAEIPTTKPDTWSDQGTGYINAVVAPLGDGPASPLLSDRSRYLFPDGTLRGRLEARLVKTESHKDCIIC